MTFLGTVSEAVAVAAEDALEKVKLGELSDLGQIESYIKSAVDNFLARYGPEMGQKLAALAQPAAEKAVQTMKPAIEQALKDYTPTFAAITGGIVALSVLLGVWVSKRTYQRSSR